MRCLPIILLGAGLAGLPVGQALANGPISPAFEQPNASSIGVDPSSTRLPPPAYPCVDNQISTGAPPFGSWDCVNATVNDADSVFAAHPEAAAAGATALIIPNPPEKLADDVALRWGIVLPRAALTAAGGPGSLSMQAGVPTLRVPLLTPLAAALPAGSTVYFQMPLVGRELSVTVSGRNGVVADNINLNVGAATGASGSWARNDLINMNPGSSGASWDEVDLNNRDCDAGTWGDGSPITGSTPGCHAAFRGLWLTGLPTRRPGTSAININSPSAGIPIFHSGLFIANGIKDFDLFSGSAAVYSIEIAGAHLAGLDLGRATFSRNAIELAAGQGIDVWDRHGGYMTAAREASASYGAWHGTFGSAASNSGDGAIRAGDVGIAANPANRTHIFLSGDTYLAPQTVPTRSSATPCTHGQISFDASYVYVCVATNRWKRASLSSY